MAEKFAKLFEFDDDRQVLALFDRNDDDDPGVQFFTNTPNSIGVRIATLGLSWPDNDSGWDKARKCLNDTDRDKAAKWMDRIDQSVREIENFSQVD